LKQRTLRRQRAGRGKEGRRNRRKGETEKEEIGEKECTGEEQGEKGKTEGAARPTDIILSILVK
jgi:hypothetical protein